MKIQKKPTSKIVIAARLSLLALCIGAGGYLYVVRAQNQPLSPPEQVKTAAPVATKSLEPEVATEAPVHIVINKIGVDASIEPVGLTDQGMMDAPDGLQTVGWYEDSAPVGGDEFAVLLDGHYGTESTPAVFWRLSELVPGDNIQLEGDKGVRATYRVVDMEQQYSQDVDMHKALYPYRSGAQSLTIITCEGLFDAENVTYDKRTIVYAERVN